MLFFLTVFFTFWLENTWSFIYITDSNQVYRVGHRFPFIGKYIINFLSLFQIEDAFDKRATNWNHTNGWVGKQSHDCTELLIENMGQASHDTVAKLITNDIQSITSAVLLQVHQQWKTHINICFQNNGDRIEHIIQIKMVVQRKIFIFPMYRNL